LVVTDSTLTLGTSVTPASAIDSLWALKSPAKTGMTIGALVGGVIGVVIASHQPRSCDLSQYPCGLYTGLLIVTGSVLTGGAVGAGIGSAIPRWRLRFP
jgi:hypothetical protein